MVGYRLHPRVSLSAGIGAIVDGSLRRVDAALPRVDVGSGPMATLGVSWLVVYEAARRPFVALSATVGYSSAPSDDGHVTAGDLRVGVAAGKTLAERFTVYATGRAFAGPVRWQHGDTTTTWSDVHHYSFGAGARVALPAQLDLFVELSALGEQSLNAGLGVTW